MFSGLLTGKRYQDAKHPRRIRWCLRLEFGGAVVGRTSWYANVVGRQSESLRVGKKDSPASKSFSTVTEDASTGKSPVQQLPNENTLAALNPRRADARCCRSGSVRAIERRAILSVLSVR